jgi:hypothetical protein
VSISRDELRGLVREVLRDLLPSQAGAEPVVMRNDDDLNAFALRVLELAQDPGAGADLRAGRLRFRLQSPPAPPPDVHDARAVRRHEQTAPGTEAVQAHPAEAVHRYEKGAVTERHVGSAAEAGARLVLGRRAVLTPLAKERVRASGVVVEREG